MVIPVFVDQVRFNCISASFPLDSAPDTVDKYAQAHAAHALINRELMAELPLYVADFLSWMSYGLSGRFVHVLTLNLWEMHTQPGWKSFSKHWERRAT